MFRQRESRWNGRMFRQCESRWNGRMFRQRESRWNMRKSRQRESRGWRYCDGGERGGALITDGFEDMDCGAVQAVERVAGAACASAEERDKGPTQHGVIGDYTIVIFPPLLDKIVTFTSGVIGDYTIVLFPPLLDKIVTFTSGVIGDYTILLFPPFLDQIIAFTSGVIGDCTIVLFPPLLDQIVAFTSGVIGDYTIVLFPPLLDQIVAFTSGVIGDYTIVLFPPLLDKIVTFTSGVIGDYTILLFPPLLDQIITFTSGVIGDYTIVLFPPLLDQIVAFTKLYSYPRTASMVLEVKSSWIQIQKSQIRSPELTEYFCEALGLERSQTQSREDKAHNGPLQQQDDVRSGWVGGEEYSDILAHIGREWFQYQAKAENTGVYLKSIQPLLGNAAASHEDERSCAAAALLIQPHTLVETQPFKTRYRQAALPTAALLNTLVEMGSKSFSSYPLQWPNGLRHHSRAVLATLPNNNSKRVAILEKRFDSDEFVSGRYSRIFAQLQLLPELTNGRSSRVRGTRNHTVINQDNHGPIFTLAQANNNNQQQTRYFSSSWASTTHWQGIVLAKSRETYNRSALKSTQVPYKYV
uniref:Uncharacterized protein n=1 Tax=Timema tahoe TaxID=61484 RepID=A0A7R9NZB7_9NEOP|nr:unnamed protein product [Timema tahoe]